MTDEEWVNWNSTNDEDWYNVVEHDFGLDARIINKPANLK